MISKRAMMQYCGSSDILRDLRRSNEMDKLENLTDETNIDSDYKDVLVSLGMCNSDMHEHNRTEREDFMHFHHDDVNDNDDDDNEDEDDDSDSEVDPDHELFFSNLKKDGNAYTLDAMDNNGVPLLVEFEAESILEDEWEKESRRKTRSCAEEMNVNSYHRGSDCSQDRSGKPNGSRQNPRMFVNLAKTDNVSVRKKIEVMGMKPPAGLKAKGLMQNVHACNVQAPISRNGNLGRCRILENTRKRKTPVQIDKERSSPKSGPRMKNMRCENDDEVPYGGMKSSKSVIESGDEIDKVRFYQNLGLSDLIRDYEYDEYAAQKVRHIIRGKKMAEENWYANPDPVRTGQRNKVHNRGKTLEVVKGKNIVNEEHEADRINMVQMDSTRFYQKPSPRNRCLTNSPYERADRARLGDKDRAQSLIDVKGLIKGKDVVKEEDKANRKTPFMLENKHFCKRPLQRSNRAVEPVEKYDNHRKLIKGKSVVQEQNEANRKAIALIDDDDLHQKPKVVNQVQLGKKDKVWSHRKSIEVGHSSHNVKALSNGREVHKKIRNVDSDNPLVACEKKKNEKNREGESDHEIAPDVQILDGSAFLQKGALTPFVHSKRYGGSMGDDDDDVNEQLLVGPSMSDVYRERVLSVLRKPFNKAEYQRLSEAVKDGSYLHYYSDLQGKLRKYRYRQGKRLTILRGFFFWLQNVTEQGAFPPWQDRECLALEPPKLRDLDDEE